MLINVSSPCERAGAFPPRPPQVLLHCMIVYTPQLSAIFNLRPLRIDDWYVVLAWSLPVVLLDEMLKFVARRRSPPALAQAAYPPRA